MRLLVMFCTPMAEVAAWCCRGAPLASPARHLRSRQPMCPRTRNSACCNNAGAADLHTQSGESTMTAQPASTHEALHHHLALCCDFDGTIAHDGVVSGAMVQALERVSASGRRLVLATGRELDDLRRVFPRLDVFDRVVAENGALLY